MSLLSSIRERISSSFERWRNRRQEEKERKQIERERRLEQQLREEKQRKFLYRLGNDFEDYVITMFNPEKFELIHRTPTNDDTNGRFVHSMVYPDLRFREIATGRKFWVEVKFGHILRTEVRSSRATTTSSGITRGRCTRPGIRFSS